MTQCKKDVKMHSTGGKLTFCLIYMLSNSYPLNVHTAQVCTQILETSKHNLTFMLYQQVLKVLVTNNCFTFDYVRNMFRQHNGEVMEQ